MTSTINKVQRRLRSQAHTERVCNFTAIPYDLAMANRRASFYADLDLLRSQFDSLDPQNTGYIGYSELTTLVKSMQGFEESMVPDLMDRLDRDKDGKVIRQHVFGCTVIVYAASRVGVSRWVNAPSWRLGWYTM